MYSCVEEFTEDVGLTSMWAVQRSTTVEANDDGEWKDSEGTEPSTDTYGAPTNDIFFDAL